ncbi:hypothetical protein AB0H57_24480 [Micromonospora sp. NPDC050686]|uniref:hypothetical protein n=1 Tax=Micromonospora sp. NPDC050686 TaxID=3154631 RepID=UPI0033CD16CD
MSARHPAWCDRSNCAERREHRSRASHIDTNRPESTIVDVALIQALHPAAAPMLSLTSIEGHFAEQVIMSIGQARALTYVMRRLIDQTKGGQR